LRSCIVGIGEPLAGDDAVGIRVVERLGESPCPGIDLLTLRDPSELTSLLPDYSRVLVVDARLDPERAGKVELFDDASRLGRGSGAARPISSHGIDALTAISLGRTLSGDAAFPEVSLLTIAIARPERLAEGLSGAALRAVDDAALRARAWARGSSRA